jgi:acylglycerol lipase
MKHLEMNWKARDGLDIFAQSWEPTILQPKAVVCLVHGHGEHTSRYAHVAEAFGRQGFVLFGADLRGHGRSGGARGHISSIEDFVQDIDVLLEEARALPWLADHFVWTQCRGCFSFILWFAP